MERENSWVGHGIPIVIVLTEFVDAALNRVHMRDQGLFSVMKI